MKSFWNDSLARKYQKDALALRVYTSRLIGREPSLVLHGGGNTSVKHSIRDSFGKNIDVLYVKGSGWDLSTIEKEGFAPVRLDVLQRLAEFKTLSDSDMVKIQRSAMLDPYAPNPSVEAILHAIIPFKFVDHTHADAVVAVSNTPGGEKRIRDIYGSRVLLVPYVMPGFILARKIYEMTRRVDWKKLEGIVLLHHGIFTFDDDAKKSYQNMIRLVSKAEGYLKKKGCRITSGRRIRKTIEAPKDLLELASLRRAVARAAGIPMIALWDTGPNQLALSKLSGLRRVASQGPLTPDHIIRTKRIPVVLGRDFEKDVLTFVSDYKKYFNRFASSRHTRLDSAPRWAVWPQKGTIAFGKSAKDAGIVSDIARHTSRAILWAERLGGWRALPPKELFEMEYWELEQAKIKKVKGAPVFQGKVALVTGAASGIGRACVEALYAQGAAVAALDIDPGIQKMFQQESVLGIMCDVTNPRSVDNAISAAIRRFGGLDILITNAGTFPPSERIAEMKPKTWQKSLEINLSGHQRMLQACVPYLSLGIDPSVVVVGSKNVPAPGPGVSAYSVAKAGLTQLARVAALELAPAGIRVNVIHPNQVFDTAIWTREVLEKRARHYGMSVAAYKTNNLLKTEITSQNVADLICVMAGPVFAKTTGSQIPIDGGNERVI